MCMYDTTRPTKKQIFEAEKYCQTERGRKIYAGRVLRDLDACITKTHAFEEWLNTQFSSIIWYEGKGKKRLGHCECGAVVPITKGRSGSVLECPACHRKALLKACKSSPIGARMVVGVIDRDERGITQQLFVAYKDMRYSDGKAEYRFSTCEEHRDFLFFNGATVEMYAPRWGKEKWKFGYGCTHGCGWTSWNAEWGDIALYPANIDRVLAGTKYQYSQLATASKASFVNPILYLRDYLHYPILEMLYKFGLYRLAEQAQDIHCGYYINRAKDAILAAKSLKDLYIYSTDELKYVAEHNLDYETLQAMNFIRNWDLAENEKTDALRFAKDLINRSGNDFHYSFITNYSLYRYLSKQLYSGKHNYNTDSYSNIFSDYTDYIGACIELDYNVNDTAISKPHDFKEMHDKITAIQKYNKSHIYDVGVAAAWSNLHEYIDHTDGTFTLRMAKTTDEIIKEGADLSHCVGRYCARVAKNESIICFIRRNEEPDKAFYTVELKPDINVYDLVQVRGYKNEDPPEEVKAFLKKYKKWYNHREAKGFDLLNLTATYFKAVRRNDKGEYVSIHDSKTKYRIGVETTVKADKNPDNVCVAGMHIASLDFAKNFGRYYKDAVILEVQVNIHDVIIPDAEDQVRCSRYKIIREVPYSELGEWGAERMKAVA